MISILRLIIVYFLLAMGTTVVAAKECESGLTLGWNYGDTVHYSFKAKINTVCDRRHWAPNTTFVDLAVFEYPKSVFQIISRPYEFAFKANKIGKFIVKYKMTMRDKYGVEQFVIFVVNIEVVEKDWS